MLFYMFTHGFVGFFGAYRINNDMLVGKQTCLAGKPRAKWMLHWEKDLCMGEFQLPCWLQERAYMIILYIHDICIQIILYIYMIYVYRSYIYIYTVCICVCIYLFIYL